MAINQLKHDLEADKLRLAAQMLDQARSIHVLGQRQAFPVAACLSLGLLKLGCRCHLLDSAAGMLPHQIASLNREDLLVVVGLSDFSRMALEAVPEAHARGVPILAISNSQTNPLARHSSLSLMVRDRSCITLNRWRRISCWCKPWSSRCPRCGNRGARRKPRVAPDRSGANLGPAMQLTREFSLSAFRIRVNWIILAAVLMSVAGLLRLSWWQLERAGEKVEAQMELETQLSLTAPPLEEIPRGHLHRANPELPNRHVSLNGHYENDRAILVLAEFFDGQIGYAW